MTITVLMEHGIDAASRAADGAESSHKNSESAEASPFVEPSGEATGEYTVDDASSPALPDGTEPVDAASPVAERPVADVERMDYERDALAETPAEDAASDASCGAHTADVSEGESCDGDAASSRTGVADAREEESPHDASPLAGMRLMLDVSEDGPGVVDADTVGSRVEVAAAPDGVIAADLDTVMVADPNAAVGADDERGMVDGAAVLEHSTACAPDTSAVVTFDAVIVDETADDDTVDGTSLNVAPRTEVAESFTALVPTLPSTARRNRRIRKEDRAVEQPAHTTMVAVEERSNESLHSVGIPDVMSLEARVALPSAAECDDAAWREAWPDNEVQIVGRLLPRATDAPTMDGVLRVRMELALAEQYDGEFGSIGNLPIFIMPDAPGFGPIYRDLMRGNRYRRRAEPIMVEMRGILRQLPDRDPRYATERYSVLMGVEVHRVSRAAPHAEQYAFWRGRAAVRYVHSYTHQGQPYRRVTAVVTHKQQKPRLRGVSVMHIPVDFLVALEHEHADRFGRVGQPLLIEANIASDVSRMKDTHPSLEGLDPERKAQLQVLRETIVSVTLGEFPDATAEQDYARWVEAGRPFPQRPERKPLSSNAAAPTVAPSVPPINASRSGQDVGEPRQVGRNHRAASNETPPDAQRVARELTQTSSQRATAKKQRRAGERVKRASHSVGDGTG
jgi:hypothetical protein